MRMRYFKNGESVYGYDGSSPLDAELIAQAVSANWQEVTGGWPPAPIVEQIHNVLVYSAQAALHKSDITIIRCYSADIPVPRTWETYRSALRAIVNGSDTTATTLPAAPAFPAGT